MVRTQRVDYATRRVSVAVCFCARFSVVSTPFCLAGLLPAALFASTALVGSNAYAQSAPPESTASEAFSHGSKAFAAGDFEKAALSFDRAYELAPHHAALWNSAQAWERAGEAAKAANRYARYLREAPDDDGDRPKAQATLTSLAARLGRLKVRVEGGGAPTIDGVPLVGEEVYVEPGQHIVEVERDEDSLRELVDVRAGTTRSVVLSPAPSPSDARPAPPTDPSPPASVAPEVPGATPKRAPEPPPDGASSAAPSSSGLSPWVTWVGVSVTALLGAATIWSGLDTQAARRDFDDAPTDQGLSNGQSKQDRTNVLFAATVGAGLVTGGVALFLTDWSGEPGTHGSRGALVGLRGVF